MSSSSSSDFSESSDEDIIEMLKMIRRKRKLNEEIFLELLAQEEGCSRGRRGPYQYRDREAAHERLMQDYFTEPCNYNDDSFERRFRMKKELFLRIVRDLENKYPYFQQGWDGRGRKGLSPLQKCTSAIRQMAYGVSADGMDDYLKIGESTARECIQYFTGGIIELYGKRYLRKPSYDDITRLYAAHDSRHGFPGMLGSVDCMHWSWDKCPTAWRGQFMRGDHEQPTIMLEAVASQDLWIWHAFFGVAGSNNDLNVLNQSPLFNDVYNGKAPQCPFTVNNVTYRHRYYLADGIYPEWVTFVKSFTCPIDEKRRLFKAKQEAARKDVERCFGVLKQKWHIIANPSRFWKLSKIRRVMYACIILHNMIIEHNGRAICRFDENAEQMDDANEVEVTAEQFDATVREVRDRETHHNLRADLIEHISQRFNDDDN